MDTSREWLFLCTRLKTGTAFGSSLFVFQGTAATMLSDLFSLYIAGVRTVDVMGTARPDRTPAGVRSRWDKGFPLSLLRDFRNSSRRKEGDVPRVRKINTFITFEESKRRK